MYTILCSEVCTCIIQSKLKLIIFTIFIIVDVSIGSVYFNHLVISNYLISAGSNIGGVAHKNNLIHKCYYS